MLSCSCIFCFLWHAYEGSAWKLDKVKNNLWVKGQSCNFVDSGGSFHCTAAFSFIYFPPFFLSSASTGELEKREKMGKKNKRRVPEVLWRLYRDRARSLSHTVTYLFTQTQLPPSNSNTSGAEDDMSFLLKHNDPTDYRNLLNNCYIVINDNARPLPSHFSLRNRWSQHQVTIMPSDNLCLFFFFKPLSLLCLQIVKKTIEMIMSENPVSSNVISSAYDKASTLPHPPPPPGGRASFVSC